MASPADKLIDKIRKLLAHADSAHDIGSEAEAQAFAEMAQAMLQRHNLDIEDVKLSDAPPADPVAVEEVYWPQQHGETRKQRSQAWEERLALAVAEANLCRTLFHVRSNSVSFIGQRHNTEVAVWLYAVLHRSAGRLADSAYAERWRECQQAGDVRLARGFRPSFLVGFVERLFERIKERSAKFKETSRALVVFDKNKKAIDDFFSEAADGLRDKKLSTVVLSNDVGLRRGRAAADRVNLDQAALRDKPVNGEPRRLGQK